MQEEKFNEQGGNFDQPNVSGSLPSDADELSYIEYIKTIEERRIDFIYEGGYKELKMKLLFWVLQLGNYNEGCGCGWCCTQIKNKFIGIMDKYIDEVKRGNDR